MNKYIFENYLKLNTRISAVFKGHFIWKNILTGSGVKNLGMLTEVKKDNILASIYGNLFKDSQKDKTISLKGIGKTYENGFKAIHNFNLEVKPKEFVCLLGPSGCGKTTALRMVAGLESITEGKYLIGSQEMNAVHPSERDTAMVFQNYALYPFMTVYDNIAFGLKLKTYKNPVYKNLIKEYNDTYFPNHEIIADLKFKVYDLAHEKKNELNEKKIIRKKLSKERKIEEVHELDVEIKTLSTEYRSSRKRNKDEISSTKTKISELKKEQSIQYKAKIKSENEIIKNSKEEVKRLKLQQAAYFETKKSDVPKMVQNLKELKLEFKKAEKELGAELKNTYKLVKSETKVKDALENGGNSKFSKKNLESQIKEIEAGKIRISSLEDKIEEIGLSILDIKDKKNIIKHSKSFEIKELKGKTSLRKSIKNDLSESVVTWKKTIPTRVRQLSLLVGIRDYLKRKPSALSGGQRQRVALIRAISKNSQLFLFDEPLSNLDAKLRSTMRSEIRKIHQNVGATSLYVTHDQIEAMTMADKVVVINLGYIQQVGSPRDLYENPSNVFVARFIGVPTINMIKVKINPAKSEYSVDNYKMKYKLSKEKMDKISKSKEKEVLLGVRPNDIILTKGKKTGLIGEVVNKELIGAEHVLDLELESGKIIKALISVHDGANIGDKFSITFAPNKVSFFNKTTGDAISSIINKETQAALNVWKESADERIKNLKILGRDRNAQKLGKKVFNKVKEGVDQDFKKNQLHKRIASLQEKQEDYKVFDEDEITS